MTGTAAQQHSLCDILITKRMCVLSLLPQMFNNTLAWCEVLRSTSIYVNDLYKIAELLNIQDRPKGTITIEDSIYREVLYGGQ